MPRGLLVPEKKGITTGARQYGLKFGRTDTDRSTFLEFWVTSYASLQKLSTTLPTPPSNFAKFFVANASDGALREAAIFCLFILDFFQLGLFRAF